VRPEIFSVPGHSEGPAEDTFPKLLRRNARIFAERTAMREKDLGIWQTWTWTDVLDRVRALAAGFAELGVVRGDRVAIIGDNRPRLYWSICAVQMLGAIPVPVYQDAVAPEMAFVLQHAEATVAVVENQEQVDKVLEIRGAGTNIRHIVYDDARGLKNCREHDVLSLDSVESAGRAMLQRDDSRILWLEREIDLGRGGDIAVILYTSGTTDRPKGVVLTNSGNIWAAHAAKLFDSLTEKEEVLAYLPMAWIGDHMFSYAQWLVIGYCVNCPESRDTVVENRREIGPTYVFAPPRVYENLLTLTMVRMQDASWLKRTMFDYFLGVARRCGEAILDVRPVAILDRLRYWLGSIFVYGPLKSRYGLSRIRVGYTAGEAIGPEIFSFYRSLGLNLKQLYGQTEAAVYITNQPDGEIFPDTVGRPLPGIEVRIDETGEVLYRSPGIFREYFNNPEATAASKTRDGWVRSGDAGLVDQHGHLKIIDRFKDVGRLADGSLFPPKYIENKLKFFPNIKEAVAFGDGRDYVACFINIDLIAVGSWAERNGVVYGSYQELAADARVYDMIKDHVAQVNRELAAEPRVAACQIRRFLVLPKELDADDGEVTRTSKVRRGFVTERYAPLIEALYDPGRRNQQIRIGVTFEDGRKGLLEGEVQIAEMPADLAKGALREAAE
jgi:long-chain acyl-CoA synthetase